MGAAPLGLIAMMTSTPTTLDGIRKGYRDPATQFSNASNNARYSTEDAPATEPRASTVHSDSHRLRGDVSGERDQHVCVRILRRRALPDRSDGSACIAGWFSPADRVAPPTQFFAGTMVAEVQLAWHFRNTGRNRRDGCFNCAGEICSCSNRGCYLHTLQRRYASYVDRVDAARLLRNAHMVCPPRTSTSRHSA